MMLQMVQDHKSLAKDKPQILTSWLSMMAFEDVLEFATLTEIVPEYLIQSLMYRLREFELRFHNTGSQKNLEVCDAKQLFSFRF